MSQDSPSRSSRARSIPCLPAFGDDRLHTSSGPRIPWDRRSGTTGLLRDLNLAFGAQMWAAAMLRAIEDISLPHARKLAHQIDNRGFAVIEDVVPEHDLRVAQQFVANAVAKNNGNYVSFVGADQLSGTFLADVAKDRSFIQLCRNMYMCGTGLAAPDAEFYQVLRCLSGPGSREHSLHFHYDSYVLTALIPIVIPSRGARGNLLVFPSTRKIRRLYITNVLDKLLVTNALSQTLFRVAYRTRYKRMISIELRPGSLYMFWGYRSIHTNEACAPQEIRATALLHYADPHCESGLKKMLRKD